MKLQELDFRIWNKHLNNYVTYSTEDYFFIPKNDNDLEIDLYTGFYDKNGTKIYEGDIVSFEADSHDMGTLTIVGVVSFENGRFIIEGHENMFPHYSFYNFISRYKDIRIIGNIHINTELLGDTK